MGSLLTTVALGWLGRRFQELGSIAMFLFSIYQILPHEHQQLVVAVLTGQGGMQSIGAYAGFAWYLWTQRKSWLATVTPQIVTRAGQQVPLEAVAQKNAVEEFAISALGQQKDTLIGRMLKLKWGQKVR